MRSLHTLATNDYKYICSKQFSFKYFEQLLLKSHKHSKIKICNMKVLHSHISGKRELNFWTSIDKEQNQRWVKKSTDKWNCSFFPFT